MDKFQFTSSDVSVMTFSHSSVLYKNICAILAFRLWPIYNNISCDRLSRYRDSVMNIRRSLTRIISIIIIMIIIILLSLCVDMPNLKSMTPHQVFYIFHNSTWNSNEHECAWWCPSSKPTACQRLQKFSVTFVDQMTSFKMADKISQNFMYSFNQVDIWVYIPTVIITLSEMSGFCC